MLGRVSRCQFQALTLSQIDTHLASALALCWAGWLTDPLAASRLRHASAMYVLCVYMTRAAKVFRSRRRSMPLLLLLCRALVLRGQTVREMGTGLDLSWVGAGWSLAGTVRWGDGRSRIRGVASWEISER